MRFGSLWRAAAVVLAGLAILIAPVGAGAATLPKGFNQEIVASGLNAPTAVAWAPDGRMFIAEKGGAVKVVPSPGDSPATLIDISSRVNDFWDRGLLDVEVDSDFENNHFLYLLYVRDAGSSNDDGGPKSSRLSRVVVNDDNTVANPQSPETVVLGTDGSAPCAAPANDRDCIPADAISHAIGTVRSAPDGTLFVGSGDAANFAKANSLALRTYDERSLVGKIVHIDRSGNGIAGHPFCPDDADLSHVCAKLYAKGFRNPFRFTLAQDGRVIVGDVGSGSREEIDVVAPGGNYGWPCYEGSARNSTYSGWELDGGVPCIAQYAAEGTPDAALLPVYDYQHFGGDAAIVGGPVYTGGEYPDEFDGNLLFGDYAKGFIKRMAFAPEGGNGGVSNFVADLDGLVDLELAPSGNLAYVQFGTGGGGTGKVWEVTYGNLVARATAEPPSGPHPLEVQFDSSDTIATDDMELTYDWDFGDGSPHSDDPSPVHTYGPGRYTATLRVEDEISGKNSLDQVEIKAGIEPVAQIDSPADGSEYVAGKQVVVTGHADDDIDGELAGDALEWRVTVHHGGHIHVLGTFHGEQASFTPVADHGLDAYYEVRLTATDEVGLEGTTSIELHPKQVPFGLHSSPVGGASVSLGGTEGQTPLDGWEAAGLNTHVEAEPSIKRDGKTYVFSSWSDGGKRSHDLTIPEDGLSLTALYRDEAVALPPPGSTGSNPFTAPDRAGPRVRLNRVRGKRALRALSGTVTDPSGVSELRVGLFTRSGRAGRCAWWGRARRAFVSRPRETSSCSKPLWIRADLGSPRAARRWRAALDGSMTRNARFAYRAVDRLGNISTSHDAGPVRR